jgi:quercetin dioxygenase-like cupin family protein
MKHASILLLFALIVTANSFAADNSAKTGVIVIGHDKVNEAFAKGAPLLSTNKFKVQAGHRTGPGEVEVHDGDTDIFYIMEGTATFVTGGEAIGTKVVAPGETRGQQIKGGQEHHLTKGDIIVIPKGVPHWFRDIDGNFNYFVVKVSD